MAENTNKLNTQLNFAIPTTQEEREKIIFLAVKILTEKEGGNITLNQLLSYVDDNLNNLSNEVAQALINKSDDGHNHDDRYYTEDEVNTKVNQLKSDLINQLYPVGYIYISLSPTSPAELFGGNWSPIKDVFLLTAGDTYSVSTKSIDGGSANVNLTIEQMPIHRHTRIYPFVNTDWCLSQNLGYGHQINNLKYSLKVDVQSQVNITTSPFETSEAGGGQPHNNMPPYKVVYAWQRIADNVA